MKITALYGETVGDLLNRVLGDDNDELEEAFYQLNQGHSSRFLTQGAIYTLPDNPESEPSGTNEGLARWQ
ncbi:hypothetical protein P7F88_25090 [Vibrio hannami]|uniref:hypothetical protein n=1 Tax=Vibrio hannami TaxID=2717094 RepID=UPI00240FA862|nr:hypothetical protein [Vibrio hannami]MDG3089140.1 hypothetical protein [Vibrio hannami]